MLMGGEGDSNKKRREGETEGVHKGKGGGKKLRGRGNRW